MGAQVNASNGMTPAQLLAEARSELQRLQSGNAWLSFRTARPASEEDVNNLLRRIDAHLAPGAEPVSPEEANSIVRMVTRYRTTVTEFASRQQSA
jgi:hypothetical protein